MEEDFIDDASVNTSITFEDNDNTSTSTQIQHIVKQSKQKSEEANRSTTANHFKKFYRDFYCAKFQDARKDLTIEDIQPEECTDRLIGHFASYLCTSVPKIKKLTSVNIYLSTMKVYLLEKFANSKLPPILNNDVWKRYTTRV